MSYSISSNLLTSLNISLPLARQQDRRSILFAGKDSGSKTMVIRPGPVGTAIIPAEQIPEGETLDMLANCIAWSSPKRVMSLQDVEQFVKEISIEEPESELAKELYKKYRDMIDETGRALIQKFQNSDKD
jgi:hypothetical protein